MIKRLLDVETRYPELEKLALALIVASKKLRPYFHAHPMLDTKKIENHARRKEDSSEATDDNTKGCNQEGTSARNDQTSV